jgi:hypothetical protein
MHRGKRCLLSAATMVVISGCSGTERGAPEAVVSQAQPLAPVPVAPIPTLADAKTPRGQPLRLPVIPLYTPPPPGNGNAAQLALADPNEIAKLRGIALRAASTAGVSSPKTIHAVAASDRHSAESVLSGAVINDSTPVYVIKMTGGPFTALQHPPGTGFPQGNVLTLTINATTHEVTDFGLVNDEPDLSQIGPLTVDLLAP